ncbi:hypothetical protein N356_gp106 [Cellulophaga phage phi14:2]|uniref:Uncharacterized protein n=1 Tax=Cellulophaga phage phi14:2 TaxID=1327990 RepID=S0A0B1_9CAUD|nr:hypothetical protein N356_gp106 [Cellulophaga phage phi14:2]AGO48999.1 hypothetical protein Phi14:2_gp121 [Cellulophaga phage phi14:2]
MKIELKKREDYTSEDIKGLCTNFNFPVSTGVEGIIQFDMAIREYLNEINKKNKKKFAYVKYFT